MYTYKLSTVRYNEPFFFLHFESPSYIKSTQYYCTPRTKKPNEPSQNVLLDLSNFPTHQFKGVLRPSINITSALLRMYISGYCKNSECRRFKKKKEYRNWTDWILYYYVSNVLFCGPRMCTYSVYSFYHNTCKMSFDWLD